ncbi:MAG: NADH-quinone oxidoreductase subunit L [Chloroflexota bacterium]|nr:MAG: NADH-quinone oxidoreductase subunit L [Chloroflexota bacterium]
MIWVVLLPLLGFLFAVFLGELVPRRVVGYFACAAVGLAFVAGVVMFVGLLGVPEDERDYVSTLYSWIVSGSLSTGVSLLVDPLSVVMVLIVTGVGFLIHVYSLGYMEGDPGYRRFFAYMNLFVLSMLLLVLADNFVLLLVGWGGVGFTSYALIAFWFRREDAARAGVKAFVVNSIGDVGLMLGIFLLFLQVGALDYQTVFGALAQGRSIDPTMLTAITLLLLVGAVAKSAQFPLHVWLPDAMAGPTPVSALIHAATMVTAGVYLIARAYPLFQAVPFTMGLIAVIGAFTALMAAIIGLVQPNIKRVLAYSTISQLGYMFLALGLGGYTAAIFHLMTHAFFKALLFLSAGMMIHALDGEENLFKMGSLRKKLPLAFWGFLIGSLALAGLPGFSGFFSKDEILSLALLGSPGAVVLGEIALVAVAFTAFYAFRVVFLAFSASPASEGVAPSRVLHKPGRDMGVPVLLLVFLAALGGYLQFAGSAGSLTGFLAPVFSRYAPGAVSEVSFGQDYWLVALASTALAILGLLIAAGFYLLRPGLPAVLTRQLRPLYNLVLQGFYLDRAYGVLVVKPLHALARLLAFGLDQRVIDEAVADVGRMVLDLSDAFSRLETGRVRGYMMAILLGAVLILAFLLGGRL